VHSEFISFGSISDFVQRNKTLRPKLNYAIGDTIQFHLLGGADLDRDDGSFAFGGAFPLPTTTFNRKRDGYYGTLEVGDAAHRWSISGGGRTERMEDQFRQTGLQIVSNRKNAWEFGGTLEVLDGLRLHLNASRSLRFPLLDERFNFFTGMVATTLLPQTGKHYSTGLRYAFKDAWASVDFSRADLTHEIFFNPVTFANANYSSETRHDVVMISGHWHAHDLLQLSGSILISDQVNTHSHLPGYFTMDAVVNYRWQDVEMFARVDNLTSRNYSNYGVFSSFSGTDNFFPAPTATFRAGANYKF